MAARDLINIGISPDSGTGDSARRGGEKINTLFSDLYSNFGDNPIGNDPSGPFYGYRRPFYEYEYKVGELHPAGKFTTVRFKDTAGTPFDATQGFGVDAVGTFVDLDGDSVPDIYRDSEWYFMTRGEAVAADLSEISVGGVAHIVLPLAKAGDIIKIRDTLGTWSGKYISMWTTPYEFETAAQIVEWKNNTPVTTKTYPDSDAISIVQANGTSFAANYKAPVVPLALQTSNPMLVQTFDFTTTINGDTISKVNFFNKANTELEMMYRGPDAGWIVKERQLLSSFGQIDVVNDIFTEEEWIEWDQAPLTVTYGGGAETEITTGSHILCVAPSNALGARDLNTSTIPNVVVYRRMTEDPSSTEALNQINTFLSSKVVDGSLSGDVRSRVAAVYGQDSDGVSGTNGFIHTNAENLYKIVTVQQVVDTTGNILLVAQQPFDGYTQIFAPVS